MFAMRIRESKIRCAAGEEIRILTGLYFSTTR